MAGMIFFTDNYQDRSTNDRYQFEFYCRRCGNGYSSSFQHSATGFGGPGAFAGPGGWAGPGGLFGFGEGYGAYGDYWAFRALGAGMNAREQRPMAPRPDVTRGRLTPATEDLSALTASGDDPTVLAFALASRPGRVAYEVLNQPEPNTFVYRADGPDGLAAVNRALDDTGFRPAAVHAEGLAVPSRPLAGSPALALSPAGQVPHDADWQDRIAELLAG